MSRPYTHIVTWLKANPQAPAAGGKQIVNGYFDIAKPARSTLATVDLAQTPAVAAAMDNLADLLIANMPAWQSAINTAGMATQRYHASCDADIYDYTNKLDAQISDAQLHYATAAVRTAVNGTVLYERHKNNTAEPDLQNSHGLSTWIYDGSLEGLQDKLQEYRTLQFASDTSWDEFNAARLKMPTTFTIDTSTATPTTNVPFTITGTLMSGAAPLTRQPVHLERRSYTSGGWGAWANVANSYTYADIAGTIRLSLTVATEGTYQYRWHYNGTTTYQPAYSKPVNETVTKPATTALTATPAPTKVTINTPFWVNGTLKTSGGTPIAGAVIFLEKPVSGTWTDIPGKGTSTASDGTYHISASEPKAGIYDYRTNYAGNATYPGAPKGSFWTRLFGGGKKET